MAPFKLAISSRVSSAFRPTAPKLTRSAASDRIPNTGVTRKPIATDQKELLQLRPLAPGAGQAGRRLVVAAATAEPETPALSAAYSSPSGASDQNTSIEQELIALAAATSRGQSGSMLQKATLESLVDQLESSGTGMENPAENPSLNGEWLLIYSTENPTRSSPFFWAFRGLCQGVEQPLPILPPSLSEALFVITDGIPFAKCGQARHIIEGVGSEGTITLTSEVDLTLSVMDALLPPSVGVVTSTALLEPTSATEHDVTVMTTAVKKSTWAQLPPLQFMDTYEFPSQQVMDSLRIGSATAKMETTYLSEKLRVTRASGMTLVYLRDAF